MLRDLYDSISSAFSWRWPTVDEEVTAVHFRTVPIERRGRGNLRLVVEYKFSLGDDGPYTGESSWYPRFDRADLTDIEGKLRIGQPVAVRYRRRLQPKASAEASSQI